MTYTPNLWVKGDTVSSEKLNHMELGIAQNDTGLQSKVNQEDFESEITNINNRIGSPLTANAANQMTDTNKVYVYTGSETGYTNGHWYYYDGSAWQDGGVYNAVAFETDDTLTQEGEAADAKETGTRFANFANSLNETDMEFSNFKTQTNGKFSNVEQSLIDIRANASEMDDDISDVKRDLSQSVDDLKSAINEGIDDLRREVTHDMEHHETINWLDISAVTINHYKTASGAEEPSELYLYTSLIPVSNGDIIRVYNYDSANNRFDTFSMRFITAYNAQKQVIEASGSNTSMASYTVPPDIKYVVLSLAKTNVIDKHCMVLKNADEPPIIYYDYGEWYSIVNNKNKGYASVSGDLTNGNILYLPRSNNKKNNIYSFCCKVTSFNSLRIGNGLNEYDASYLTITNTELITTRYNSQADSRTVEHGLTISDFLYVLIDIREEAKAKITITTLSGTFTVDNSNTLWNGDSNARYYVQSVNSVLTDCIFTWCGKDFLRNLWVFGDSYCGFTSSARWPYYVKENGWLDNIYLNAFPGEDSDQAMIAFKSVITNYGKPKTLVWALGMNDGSDTNGTPSNKWLKNVNIIIEFCKSNDVELILCTIPSVPSINNEGKNNYVRSSDYRYIDFAKAVGATSEGVWYSEMLYTDNVHPTAKGAIALFHRAITDCPEITFS